MHTCRSRSHPIERTGIVTRMPSDPLPSVDALILDVTDALESDDVPIWEFVWRLNAMCPDAQTPDKIRLARRAVTQLLGQEYGLWRGEWPSGPVAPLTERDVRQLADDDAAWTDPDSASVLVWLRATG